MKREAWLPSALEMYITDWWDEDIAWDIGKEPTVAALAKHAGAPVRRTLTAVRELRRAGFLNWTSDAAGVWRVSRAAERR